MANRKYESYEVAVSSGDNAPYESYETYQEAFSVYQHFKTTGAEHATLWGIDEMGEYTCIMSF